MERAIAMGVSHKDFPHFAGGDVIINLSEHYTLEWNPGTKSFERRVVVYADGWCELLDESLKSLIGVDEWPFVVWSEDAETNDIYPDGVADLVRTPNKIVNVWYSQLIENRTLANFRMHWYDATNDGYTPQTYEPGPGRMLPAPGNPRDTIQPVELSGLDESLNAINFVTTIIERGSGAVAIEKGVGEEGSQTLGEVEIMVGKAMERSVALQKFYRGSWYELCVKWEKMMQANAPSTISLYRTGTSGKLYEKKVMPGDWQSKAGYEPVVSSTSEQEMNQVKSIQKFQYLMAQFPENQALRKIAQRRQLELLDFSPDELKLIQDEQEEKQEQMEQQMNIPIQEGAPQQAPQMPSQAPVGQSPDEVAAMKELQTALAETQ